MFYVVPLPNLLIKQGEQVPISSVKFFSDYCIGYLHDILKFVTGTHRDGWSFNGSFESKDIIWVDGRVYIQYNTIVVFDSASCSADYLKLYQIFTTKFLTYGYPAHFLHLLNYLCTCPAGGLSNTESVIGFVSNHPCLEPFMDRMKQVMILANILHRLDSVEYGLVIGALGDYKGWIRKHVHGVPEMDGILYFFNTVSGGGFEINPNYTDSAEGCLNYSYNYLKHATNQVGTVLSSFFFSRDIVCYLLRSRVLSSFLLLYTSTCYSNVNLLRFS